MNRYSLGKKFPNTYFIRREAECMIGLLNKQPINIIAAQLSLSISTVNFYINNIYKKLKCVDLHDLIEKISKSDLLKNIDFTI